MLVCLNISSPENKETNAIPFSEIKYIAFHSIKSGQSANFMAEFTRNVRLLLSDYFRFRHETAISFRVNLNKNLEASEGPSIVIKQRQAIPLDASNEILNRFSVCRTARRPPPPPPTRCIFSQHIIAEKMTAPARFCSKLSDFTDVM